MKRIALVCLALAFPAYAVNLTKPNTGQPFQNLKAGVTTPYTFTVKEPFDCVMFKTEPTAGTAASQVTITLGSSRASGPAASAKLALASEGRGVYHATVKATEDTRIGVGYWLSKKVNGKCPMPSTRAVIAPTVPRQR